MTSLDKKILHTISEQELRPRPRWYFVVINLLSWFGVIALSIVAAFFISLLMFQGGNVALFAPRQIIQYIVLSVVLLTLFLLLAILQIRMTKGGYKKQSWVHGVIIAIIVCIAGIGFFNLKIHERAQEVHPRIGHIFGGSEAVYEYWSHPEETGILGGEVFRNSEAFVLEDFQGQIWALNIDDLSDQEHRLLDRFLRVRAVGYVDEEVFHVCAVSPWELRGARRPRGVLGSDAGRRVMNPDIQSPLDRQNTPTPRGRRGNIDFDQGRPLPQQIIQNFKAQFEIKSEILRSNKCQ